MNAVDGTEFVNGEQCPLAENLFGYVRWCGAIRVLPKTSTDSFFLHGTISCKEKCANIKDRSLMISDAWQK